MPPASAAAVLLLLLAPGPLARGDTLENSRPTLIQGFSLSSPTAPHQFRLAPGDQPLAPALPQQKRRKFSMPRFRIVHPDDGLCYFVRSYRYARQSRDSDVTTPVGYTTCTAARKFEMKNADLPAH